jgi:hypothetical protein
MSQENVEIVRALVEHYNATGDVPGGHAAIAEDRRIQTQRTNVALPMLDVNHALMTGERFKKPSRSDVAI